MKIVIADDHALFRAGLRSLLSTVEEFQVVAEVSNGADAVRELSSTGADALLLDVEMPGQSVFATIAAARRIEPAPKVAVLSMHDDAALSREFLRAGACASLSKTAPFLDVVAAINAPKADDRTPRSGPSVLSDRELEVLVLMASALTNREIGHRLGISPGTVKRHASNIFEKCGAVSRLDAVRRGRLLGLI